jgi:peptidoglycan hydrolase-like protein with peptidoglycan-binding domain
MESTPRARLAPSARAIGRPAAAFTAVVAALVTGVATLTLSAAPAVAGNRVTPGNFTGYGFDQCVAPSQQAMDRWLTTSPYWSVGIYIAGDSRACPDQPNLTRRWVSTQLRRGWRLLPLTVGPQAACNARYKKATRIVSDPTRHYAAARAQGRAEAGSTARAARALGITARSTLWYDIESFSISGERCRGSAIAFLSSWTHRLHALHYVSGVYSSAASGIKMLDDVVGRPAGKNLPDRVWIADWNGKADIYSSYVRSTTWMPHRRVHQYRGGHLEVHGGVTINVDSNFMSLGHGSVAPTAPRACGVGINLGAYPRIGRGDHGREVKALHCLLKRKGVYDGGMHGSFKDRTVAAVRAYQRTHHLPVTGVVSRPTWVQLLSSGGTPVVKYGSVGEAVRRVQRAMNAAVGAHLAITGVYLRDTARAVRAYQRSVLVAPNGVVADPTWDELTSGVLGRSSKDARSTAGPAAFAP